MEVHVLAGLAALVPLLHGLRQLGCGQTGGPGQLLDRVGLIAIAALGDGVAAKRGEPAVHAVLVARRVADEPGVLGHGQVRPLAAELHVAVAAAHVRGEVAFCHGVPVHHDVGVVVRVEAAAVYAHGDALRLGRTHGGELAVDGRERRPEAGAAVHVPHVGAHLGACRDAVAVVRLRGNRTRRGAGEVVGAHLLVVLKAAAAHDDALARTCVDGGALALVRHAQDGLRGRVLYQGRHGGLVLERHDVSVQHHLVVDDLLHVVVLPVGAVILLLHVHEVETTEAEGVRHLAILGVARGTRAGLEVLGDVGLVLEPRGETAGPVQVLADALGVGGQHVVGRVVHVAAELLQVLGEALHVLRPQHHAGGVLRVAAAELRGALLQQQARGALALQGNRRGGGHAGQAGAHHDDVVLLVPRDVVHGRGRVVAGGQRRCGGLGDHAHREGAAQGEAGSLEEAAAGLRFGLHVRAPLRLDVWRRVERHCRDASAVRPFATCERL